jgi:hypothetical protein
MLNIIDDETAARLYNEIDITTGDDYNTKAKALEAWADAKDSERNKQDWDHLTRVYTDFDNYISDEGYSDLEEESRYRIANRQFIANQLGETVEDQNFLYPAKRDIWTQQAFGKKGLSEKETFGLIQQGVQSRNEVVQSANEIPGDIALGLFDSIGQGTAVEVPKLVSIWKERNAEKLKKLPAGWESGLLQAASDYATETEGMLRNYSEPLKQVYDHLASVTGRDTERAGETNPKSMQEIEGLADTLATMPPEVRDRAYAAVVLGAKQAGQEPKEFLEQWGESWSRTLNMFRSGSMVMQEDAAYSELQLLKEAPKVWKDTDTGKLTVYPGFDQSNAKEITPEERTELTAEAQKKFDRLQVYRELYNIADNQFDPIKKINEGGFGGFMEAMAYGSPQALAYTGMALVPGVGPWMTGAAIYSEEYNKLRLDGVNPETARSIAAPSAILQSGLERVGAKMIFGKLPAFEKLMTKIGNPARVGRAGSAGIRFGTAVVGENIVEGTQDLVTPVVQDVAAALGADVPDVDWGSTLGQWGTSRLDVLAATIPGILIGTGVATIADGKRFNDFNERLDLYRTFGMDEAAIKRVEDNQTPQDRQVALQSEYKKLTPDNIKAGISYMESKIDEAKSMQEDPNLPTITREQGENGKPVFVVRDEKGAVAYRSEEEQAAMSAITQLFKGQLLNERNVVVDLRNQWLAEDPTNVAIESDGITAQEKLEKLQAAGNVAQIEELHRRIATSPYKDTPYDQINILGEATVEDLGEMVFRGVITLNQNSRPEDAREEIHHVAVRKALMKGSVTLDTLRGWLDATETALPDKFPGLVRDNENDIVESLARVQRAYEDGKINADEEMALPASFVDYIKRMLKAFKEVLQRAVALRGAFKQGILPGDYESFLAESVGLNQQTMVDTTRERVGGELAQGTFNYSVGQRVSTDTNPFKGWFGEWDVDPTTASKVVDPDGKPMVVYHGTQRADRVGDRFRKSRATSGPMAFFTNDPAIASSYSTNKRDTSAEMPSDYAGWFKWKGKGMRSPVAIDRAWWNLSPEERAAVNERIYTIGYSDWDASEGPIVADSQSIMSRDSIDYELRQARGNGLRALVEMWLSSGSLFNQEERFLEVLQAAGVKGATLDDPNAARSAVYPVYLSIKNPLDTASIPGDVVSALEQAGKRKRAKQSAGGNPDAWDKNTISGNDWMAALKEDMAKGTTHAWTRIPDWVTETLSSLGYDGIKDTGGKNGGVQHQVWIPFNETQVKSATGNRGTFDPTSANINYSIGKNYSNEEKYNQIVPEISSVNPNKVSRRDMYEVAKVSPDVASNMSFEKPIEVSLFADGTLMLSDGHHRLAAAKQLGMNSIPAVVRSINAKGNHINALIAEQQPGATNYSIGMTVAPLRRDSLSELNKKEMQKRASSAKFIHLQQVIDDVANAYGVKIESRQPVIGGWVESGQISLEVPEAILFDTDDLEMAQEMAAIVGASAPELQNAVMLWKDDDAGKDTVLEFQAKGADSALAIAKDLNNAGLNGFTYDTKTRKFSLVLAGVSPESIPKVYDYINDQSKTGNISSRGGTQARSGVAAFPSESDYRGYLQGARSRADLLQQGQREALLDVVDRAERRVDRYAAALKISEQAKKIQKKLKRPSTSALAIESELKGKQFDNIRQLGLYLDARFNKVFGKPSFEIGGQEGIDIASDAFVYDIIDGLAGDGSGMGWYDERVQETIRELSKLHPEFATDSNALAVYIGILATTSQGYTVVENFKQANKVYNEYKRTGRIPTDFKFAKSSDPINSNLAQIQGLIDEHGLDGYAEFMDQEVTGQALRDQFGKTPTGVTLKDTVRGNRVLGPKIGSFFNNLRGQFDTITMDLWYTRTMHRFLGETVVPLDSDKMQKAITKFREELKKDGVRTYGIDLTEALKDDEATVQAALTLFQRWARGDNDYTEKGYFKFPDGYKIEKAARGIFSIGGMKGAPQNKTHRQYFAKVVLEAKAKLAKLGMKLTEADMQAIIWYREKNLFARTGVANAAAKPADYLDAVMVARSGAQAQEDIDPADLEAEDGDTNYSIASQPEIDRVNRALGGMNRGPDERLKVYERAKQKFSKLMAWNSDELGAMADTGSDETQIRRTQLLQGFGELDAILQVLPPEVRGRVGGYTVLANIAPMDVFKDGVKVSEAKNMDGAIISAWMKEGQNIGQAGKQVSLPPGYTAKENLASKRADKALADFFRDRIKKIDTELEKVLVREYTEAIAKAVKQSRPKAGDNGVRTSTLGAETQKFADMVQRATLLDDEATPKRMAEIEAALANPDATAEDISALSEEWSILNTFGDLDNRSSETLAQGLDWLKGQLQMGREAWRIKEQARIDEQRARAASTIEWLGKGTAKKRFADKGLMQRITEVGNNYLLDHASFEQFVTAMLPPEIAANFSVRLRKADMAAQSAEIRDGKGILDAVREGAKAANMSAGDAMLWLKGDQKNAVAYLEGRKVKDERIAIELAQKIVTGEADRSKLTDADIETLRNELAALPADTQKEYVTIKRVIFRGEDVKLDMSRAKAIQLLLSWSQPDVQIKMRKEGWTDESATDLKALVNDPVSRSVVSYLQSLYGKGAGIVNPVYSRMFGMTMPQVKNYAPTRFLNAKDSKDIGLDGSPTATGTTPSFAKTRVTHSAKIAAEDALTVAQGHIAQQAHWVHFAELAREFRALLSSPEVRESLKQKHGDAVLKSAELWADQLEQRGGNKARESAWLNNVIGTAISGKAVASLGFNLKTLAMQLENTIRFGLSLDMKQIASALSQPGDIIEDIQTVWESDAIQNRLQGGATAEARFLFSRYAGKPNFAAKIAEASMTPINWLDSAGTSISSAIVYRANLNDALDAGMPENLAKQAALNAASEAIYRFAQPVSFGQKSIIENNGNVFAKTFFLFMSDPRLKTAILADAARGLATRRGNASEHIRRIVAVELMALVSHVISSAFKDTFSDDDDEEIWGIGGFAKAMLLAPFQGFFFAGSVAEVALSKLTGQGYFTSSQNPLLNTAESAIRAGSNLDDAFNFSDPEAMLKEWNNIFRSMALSPAMAAPAVLLNMVKPALGLYQNATTED